MIHQKWKKEETKINVLMMQLTKCWSDESDSNSLTFGGLRGSNKKCDWIKLKIPRMFVNFTKLIWLDNRRLRWEDRSRAHMWCDLVSNGIGNVTRVVSFDLRYWRLETYTERWVWVSFLTEPTFRWELAWIRSTKPYATHPITRLAANDSKLNSICWKNFFDICKLKLVVL